MRKLSKIVYVQHHSLQSLEDKGMQFGISAELGDPKEILTVLTNRQKQVADLLEQGYTRKEIATQLLVCTQAIHQIVLRIRKRLSERAGVDSFHTRSRRLTEDTKNLLFMFILTNPNLPANIIYEVWTKHPLLKDYDKPSYQALKRYLKSIR